VPTCRGNYIVDLTVLDKTSKQNIVLETWMLVGVCYWVVKVADSELFSTRKGSISHHIAFALSLWLKTTKRQDKRPFHDYIKK
jgi:hypothetical protein